MSEKTYTHKDLATLLGVSETTVKSYRRKFPGCIPVANHGKPIRFNENAAKVSLRIRDLFETGMSVEEVRARLAKEFDWISPENPEDASLASAPASRRVSRVSSKGQAIGPELSIGVSNMAKSMVGMTQQQKSIMTTMENIEAMLAGLGLKGNEDFTDLKNKNTAAIKAREEAIDERFSRVENSINNLALSVQDMARALAAIALGQNAQPAASAPAVSVPVAPAPAPGQEVRTDTGEHAVPPAAYAPKAKEDGKAAGPKKTAILRFNPSPQASETIPQGNGEKNDTATTGENAQTPEAPAHPEPSRDFYALPMVVRTQEGRYISAGGRGRGRFSITDLKALLSNSPDTPGRFLMRWEAHGQGWWLLLEQEGGERKIKLLLMELPTQKSGNVAEILKLRSGDTDMHPAEFSALLETLGE